MSPQDKEQPHSIKPDSIQPEELEAGLQAVFGAEPSVLARLAGGEGFPSPPLLKESASEETPMLSPASGREGRYQVTGEVARGGVGIVLRGHDVDLGRDVAMKVIRPEHAESPDVLQRFVEEAQIGGQLQHPGIVPVYEIGLGHEGRPYFTMKLVKGETLASLLKDRTEAGASRGLLRVFESVCQTMAYAHSRGVIHRDLKPANVMVGAFGEVLVVDWGMGKVLKSGGTADETRASRTEIDKSIIATFRSEGSGSASIVGSVMGTPRYMPPEQARGDIDAVDERSDVFALGAILCEILTGEPPYTGMSREALVKAGKADLGDALARLEACDAEEDLAELCKQCLSPAPGIRPQSAGELSRLVGEHMAAVEERAREARMQAAAAEVRAEEERRRRRVTLALTASVLAFVLLGGGGWLFLRKQAEAREAETERLVAVEIEQAVKFQGEGAAKDDPSAFDPAFGALGRAEAIVAARGASGPLVSRLTAVRASTETARDLAAAHAEQRARDARLELLLEDYGMLLYELEPAEVEQTLRSALLEYGLDLSATDAEIRAFLDGSRIRSTLWELVHLIARAETLRSTGMVGSPREQQVRIGSAGPAPVCELATRLETDPWRRRLAGAKTKAEFMEIAEAPDVLDRPVTDIHDLAWFLTGAGEIGEARRLLVALVQRDPADFHSNLAVSQLFHSMAPRDPQRGLRHAAAAVAARPESARARHNLAMATYMAGRGRDALLLARDALGLESSPQMKQTIEGAIPLMVLRSGGPEAAVAAARQLVADSPEWGGAHSCLAQVLWHVGAKQEALAAARRGVELDATTGVHWWVLGLVLADLGDVDGAQRAALKALELRPGYRMAFVTLAVTSLRHGENEKALAWARKAAAPGAPFDAEVILANVLLRTGRLEEGEAQADRALRLAEQKPEMGRALAGAQFQKAVALAMRGDGIKAEEYARKGLEDWPRSLEGLGVLRYALEQQGRMQEALAIAQRCVQVAPGEPSAHDALGTLYVGMQRPAEALSAYREALRLDPGHRNAIINIGTAYLAIPDPVRGCQATAKALEIAANDADVLTNHANALLHLERYEEALPLYEEASGIDGAHVQSRVGQFSALLKLRRLDEAEDRLEAAERVVAGAAPSIRARFSPQMPVLKRQLQGAQRLEGVLAGRGAPAEASEFAGMGDAKFQRGQAAEALAFYRDAFRLEPRLATTWHLPFAVRAARAAVQVGRRSLALALLTREVANMEALARAPDTRAPLFAQARMRLLRYWPELAPVRDEPALAKLPEAEEAPWRALWKQVAELLKDE